MNKHIKNKELYDQWYKRIWDCEYHRDIRMVYVLLKKAYLNNEIPFEDYVYLRLEAEKQLSILAEFITFDSKDNRK